jgi:hypothetical protein
MALFATLTMVSSGLILLIIPPVAQGMFSDSLAQPIGQ